jgi:hypothetical protein
VATESAGTSRLGEIWYAESDTPLGPWAYARKVVTHQKQSFYNPRHHAFFDQQGGRVIYFEGTYTHTFSGNAEQTPRYDYNQIMYRLDLADPRIRLPVGIRRQVIDHGEQLIRASGEKMDSTFREVLFFACDRAFPNSKPFFADEAGRGGGLTRVPSLGGVSSALFHALDSELEKPSACVPLFEYTDNGGKKRYRLENAELAGFKRAEKPLCFVWPVPVGEPK